MISYSAMWPVILLLPVLSILGLVIWNAWAWPRLKPNSVSEPGRVSVLIPARNEEANLRDCLDSVLAQGATVGAVIIYDDHSTDGTVQIIRDYAERDSRVQLLAATELPAGWCGKPFACAQLAARAQGDWLLFLDADARLVVGAVDGLLTEARARRLTLLSAWPGLVQVSFWEKVLMPLLNFVVLTLFPAPLSVRRAEPSLGLAHGACLLVERASYQAVGGHAAVQGELFEDQRLAQVWRAEGQRGLCLDGQDVVRVRMYQSFGEIWRGFQKNFYPAFRRERSFWSFLLFHALVLWGPFLLLGWRPAWPVWLAAAGVLSMRLVLAVRFQQAWWSVLWHPLAEVILLALGLASWWRCKSGRGVEWKGRKYHLSAERL